MHCISSSTFSVSKNRKHARELFVSATRSSIFSTSKTFGDLRYLPFTPWHVLRRDFLRLLIEPPRVLASLITRPISQLRLLPSMFSYLNPLPSLPQYTGPYKVAVTDYEIPVSEISSTSTTAPDLQISTIKFRIYYPTPSTEVAKEPVYWLPDPQKQWNEAFASFLGAPAKWSSFVSKIWSVTNYAKLPVIKNSSLLPADPIAGIYPVCFFSHGLGGNTNIYSSIVGSLASCGVVTIVPEHRDGSSPIGLIRNAKGEIEKTIPYQKLSHTPDAKVLNARNAQLRIRLWELELAYTTVKAMNEGKHFTNYAEEKKEPALDLKSKLNFAPGSVTWAGHSFGAATMTQFVKSIFHHQHLPEPTESDNKEWDWTPLYQTKSGSDLVQQITPESPVVLLDTWTMPLRGESTAWLWELPMPCYSRTSGSNDKPNTVGMVSGEFYRYEGIFNRTRALLSKSPAQAIQMIESGAERKNQKLPPAVEPTQEEPSNSSFLPDLSKQEPVSSIPQHITTTLPSHSQDSSRSTSPTPPTSDHPSPISSQSSLSLHGNADQAAASTSQSTTAVPPHLYHIPHSAHLSQSDFGLLFPNLTRYAMKALDPHKTIEMNVRAILATMAGRGLPVRGLVERDGKRSDEDYIFENEVDSIVGATEAHRRKKEKERWVRVPLVEA